MLPEYIDQYLAFSDCFVDIYKQKTCLALTKNLKFFEYYQKQLMSSIDLSKTCLNGVQDQLQKCKTPNRSGKWSISNGEEDTGVDVDICFGKYVFHTFNIMKVYLIVKCWNKCVILHRLPNFKGFILKAEYENFHSFRIVHGPIKYCPVLEVQLKDNTIFKTDFEDGCEQPDVTAFANNRAELKMLLERVRSAQTELELHKGITAQSFERLQNRLTFGQPHVRSLKLDEKQMLARCGDIWKRLSPQDDLVIGIPLVNQCAAPNLTILHNLQPLIQVDPSPGGSSLYLEYRLFQLKQSFDQLDSVEVFLQSEDEELQANVWSSDTKCQLLPESFAVLVIKFSLSQIISQTQCPLLLHYEVFKDYYSSTTTTPLQIFLETMDFNEILYEQRSKYVLTFKPETLQQDFLTIAMSSFETCLDITFEHHNDLDIFESCIQQKFEFEKLQIFTEDSLHHRVFYNHGRNSLWFGCLSLRHTEVKENEKDHCITSWKFYCPNEEKMVLFIKMLLNDLIFIGCNVVSINTAMRTSKEAKTIADFENSLRQELNILKQLNAEQKSENNFEQWSKMYIEFCKAQMNSDILRGKLKTEQISRDIGSS